MRRFSVCAALAVVGLGMAGQAWAAVMPLPAKVSEMRAEAVAAGRAYAFLIQGDEVVDVSASLDGGAVSAMDALVTPAQLLTFGGTTTNVLAGPTTYSFLFGKPVTPGMYSRATVTGGVTLTNGASGTSAVGVSATYPSYMSVYGKFGVAVTNLGADLGTAGVTATGNPGEVTSVSNFGMATATFAPAFYDGFEALLTYTQSDAQSVASWSGAATLAVPEPAMMGVVGLGMVVMGMRRRGR